MHPGQLKAQDPLGAVCSDLDRISHSSGTQFLHGTDARVEMEDLKRSTYFPQTQHSSIIPCSMVGRLYSRLSVLGRQHWECKQDHWWGRFVKKSQMKLPSILAATIMWHVILSWAWNQVTFLLMDSINCYWGGVDTHMPLCSSGGNIIQWG